MEDQVVNLEISVNETSPIPRLIVFVCKELNHVIDTRDSSNRLPTININYRALIFLGLCPCLNLAMVESAPAAITAEANGVNVNTVEFR